MRNTGKINKSKIESNFTTIRNDLIRDKNLSMQEKSLLFFILSHPPNWSINRQYLYNSFSDSKSGIDKAFIGLTDKGFIKKIIVKIICPYINSICCSSWVHSIAVHHNSEWSILNCINHQH